MRRFIKGLLAGTLLGVLAGAAIKPSRKPELKDVMDVVEGARLKKKTGKMLK